MPDSNMRAVLIDPEAREVREVAYSGHYTDIYRHIAATRFEAARFDEAHGPNGDAVFVDDDGQSREVRHWFWIAGYPNPLIGRGMVLGRNRAGASVPPRHTLAEIVAKVEFGGPVRVRSTDGATSRLLWLPSTRGARPRSLEGL